MSTYLSKLGPGGLVWLLLALAYGAFTLYQGVTQHSLGDSVSGMGFIIFGAAAAFRATPPGLGSMPDHRRELIRLVLLVVSVVLMVTGGLLK